MSDYWFLLFALEPSFKLVSPCTSSTGTTLIPEPTQGIGFWNFLQGIQIQLIHFITDRKKLFLKLCFFLEAFDVMSFFLKKCKSFRQLQLEIQNVNFTMNKLG